MLSFFSLRQGVSRPSDERQRHPLLRFAGRDSADSVLDRSIPLRQHASQQQQDTVSMEADVADTACIRKYRYAFARWDHAPVRDSGERLYRQQRTG